MARLPDLAKFARFRPGPPASDSGLADSFGDNPGALRMHLVRPEGLAAGAPLVVALHGCGQTGAGYAQGTGWAELAARHGFALLLPEQTRANNQNTCFNWFQPEDFARDGGEVASIRAMVGHALATYGLDRRRVFVTGLSAGGAMACALLATCPDMFAAGAIIAGLPFGCATTVQEALDCMFKGRAEPAALLAARVRAATVHRGPWPLVSVWHGTMDQTVKPANAGEIVKQWTALHDLPETPTRRDEVDGVPHSVWCAPDGLVRVERYDVPGMAHGAPIAPGADDPDRGCGRAAPFILDVGVSSTWRIARSWGLVPAGGIARPRPAAPSRQTPRALIERTLRGAGLLPGR